MALQSESIPTFLDEFRTLKLDSMIRDVRKLTPDELLRVKKEIEKLLIFEESNA